MGEPEAKAASREVATALKAAAVDAEETFNDDMRFVVARSMKRARSLRIHLQSGSMASIPQSCSSTVRQLPLRHVVTPY